MWVCNCSTGFSAIWWCISWHPRRKSRCPRLPWESVWEITVRREMVSQCYAVMRCRHGAALWVTDMLLHQLWVSCLTAEPDTAPTTLKQTLIIMKIIKRSHYLTWLYFCHRSHADDVHWDVFTPRRVWGLSGRTGLRYNLLSQGAEGNGYFWRLALSCHMRILCVCVWPDHVTSCLRGHISGPV